MATEVEITPTLWLEIAEDTFTLVKDYSDCSPLAYVDLSKDQARLVHEQLGKFLMGCYGSVEEDDLDDYTS